MHACTCTMYIPNRGKICRSKIFGNLPKKAFGGNKFGDYSERAPFNELCTHIWPGFISKQNCQFAKYKPPPTILYYMVHTMYMCSQTSRCKWMNSCAESAQAGRMTSPITSPSSHAPSLPR